MKLFCGLMHWLSCEIVYQVRKKRIGYLRHALSVGHAFVVQYVEDTMNQHVTQRIKYAQIKASKKQPTQGHKIYVVHVSTPWG